MTKIIAATAAALTIAALSFAPAMAATTVTKTVTKHPGMHQVCKVVLHNHRKVKTCTWVKNTVVKTVTKTTTKK